MILNLFRNVYKNIKNFRKLFRLFQNWRAHVL